MPAPWVMANTICENALPKPCRRARTRTRRRCISYVDAAAPAAAGCEKRSSFSKKAKPPAAPPSESFSASGKGMPVYRSLSSIAPSTSAAANGSVESSSSRKEWLLLLLPSTIFCFIAARTSWLTDSVLYLSSQYMVEMRYSCWMDSTGHSSLVISDSFFLPLLPMTRNVTACLMKRSSSQLSPAYSGPTDCNQFSTCSSPVLTYSPLLKEQHSRRSRSWLNSCTFMKLNSWRNRAWTNTLGTALCFKVVSNSSKTARMSPQDLLSAAACEFAPCSAAAPVRGRADRPLGVWMQLLTMGEICFFTLSRIIGKIFCTKASSCCLNNRAGYLASTCLNPPTPPPWMEASACDRGVEGDAVLRPNRPPNTARAVVVTGRRDPLPLAGLMFFWSMFSSVTVLVSQYASAALLSCCFSIWLPITPMMRSKSVVRSAWNARHCRQHRKISTAATGRPLLNPKSVAMADSNRSSSVLRFSCMRACCLACSSRVLRSNSLSTVGEVLEAAELGVRGERPSASSPLALVTPIGKFKPVRDEAMESYMALAIPGARCTPVIKGASLSLAVGVCGVPGAPMLATADTDAAAADNWRSLSASCSRCCSTVFCSSSTCARASSRCPHAFCSRVMRSSFIAWNFFSSSLRSASERWM
mmetsp:Transcript_6218/g.16491  ORF Transcript_6218/g.16491 Transcript_6218/m.16491 type:complete len:643 (-) Transcript_6218:2036-3964(-)